MEMLSGVQNIQDMLSLKVSMETSDTSKHQSIQTLATLGCTYLQIGALSYGDNGW